MTTFLLFLVAFLFSLSMMTYSLGGISKPSRMFWGTWLLIFAIWTTYLLILQLL